MSKYHRLQATVANWTTSEGVSAKLQDNLELKGYGDEFQFWRDGLPLHEEAARRAIISKVTTQPVAEYYLHSLQETINQGMEVGGAGAMVKGSRLMFEHGSFKYHLNFAHSNPDGIEIVIGQKEVKRKLKHRNKGDIKREERSNNLQDKLDNTLDTNEADYLLHANQCGYLMKNTTVRFFAQIKDQRGTSTETKIRGIALPELQEFIDSTGSMSLSEISTHVDTSLEKTIKSDNKKGDEIEAVHSDFVDDLLIFLNLEFEVDIRSIKRQHREERIDSGFQPIEHWIKYQGGSVGMVQRKLAERRALMDSAKIAKAFDIGYKSNLMDHQASLNLLAEPSESI